MSDGDKYTEKEGRVGDGGGTKEGREEDEGGAKEGLSFYGDVMQWSWRVP